MDIAQKDIYEVQAAMEQWTDGRVIPAPDLEALLLFLFYIPKTLSQFGMSLRAFSFRQKHGQTLMTAKAKESDTPLVVFITANTPTGCIVRFLNLLEDDRLMWVKDRYP